MAAMSRSLPPSDPSDVSEFVTLYVRSGACIRALLSGSTCAMRGKVNFSDPHTVRRVRLLLASAWVGLCLVVLAGSLLPGVGPSSHFPHADKLVHFSAWALLAAFVPVLLAHWRLRLAAIAGLFLLGGMVEIVQGFIPGRSSSLADLGANGLGVLAGVGSGVLLAVFVARRRRDVAAALVFDGDAMPALVSATED
jgi:VanZ family protein